MDRRKFLGLTAAGTAALTFPGLNCMKKPSKRPNFMIIMADDLGFSDPECFGGEVKTPTLNMLANNGLRFDNFYNCSRCCPTRASLMTGQYPHTVNMATMANDGYSLGKNGVTVAEVLKEAGYKTSMFGKWHLSEYRQLDNPEDQQKWLDHQMDPGVPFSDMDTYPTRRGFEDFYGVILGVIDYYDPYSLMDGENKVDEVKDGYYFTDAITDRAITKLDEYKNQDEPFFMYVAHAAPHWPLHVPAEEADKYEDVFDKGWNEIRKDRFKRQIELGLFDETAELPQVENAGIIWDDLSEEEKEFMSDKMAAHAGMIDRLDQNVGRLIETLKKNDQLDNTVIIFLSDNGASPETPRSWGPGLDRPSQTRDGEEVHYKGSFEAGPQTTFYGLGPAWANTANSPFRFWKAEEYEGGAHTPGIVHWPAGISQNGGVVKEHTHVMDVLPTFLELAKAQYPTEYNGHKINPYSGKSLVPIFKGHTLSRKKPIFFEHYGAKAVITDDGWKLVAPKSNTSNWELYNLNTDPTEMKNLAEVQPEKVRELNRAWLDWATSIRMEEYPVLKRIHGLEG